MTTLKTVQIPGRKVSMCAACTAAPLSILTVSNPTSSEEEAAALLPRHNLYNYNFFKSFKK
jgi:hypothetical protein